MKMEVNERFKKRVNKVMAFDKEMHCIEACIRKQNDAIEELKEINHDAIKSIKTRLDELRDDPANADKYRPDEGLRGTFPLITQEDLDNFESSINDGNKQDIIEEVRQIIDNSTLAKKFRYILSAPLMFDYNLNGIRNKKRLMDYPKFIDILFKATMDGARNTDAFRKDLNKAFKLCKVRLSCIKFLQKKKQQEETLVKDCKRSVSLTKVPSRCTLGPTEKPLQQPNQMNSFSVHKSDRSEDQLEESPLINSYNPLPTWKGDMFTQEPEQQQQQVLAERSAQQSILCPVIDQEISFLCPVIDQEISLIVDSQHLVSLTKVPNQYIIGPTEQPLQYQLKMNSPFMQQSNQFETQLKEIPLTVNCNQSPPRKTDAFIRNSVQKQQNSVQQQQKEPKILSRINMKNPLLIKDSLLSPIRNTQIFAQPLEKPQKLTRSLRQSNLCSETTPKKSSLVKGCVQSATSNTQTLAQVQEQPKQLASSLPQTGLQSRIARKKPPFIKDNVNLATCKNQTFTEPRQQQIRSKCSDSDCSTDFEDSLQFAINDILS